jgi:pilus assembly protein Flp/PilA
VLTKHEKGQGLVEYALIVVLVSLVSIIALQVLGPYVGNVFSTLNYTLGRVAEYSEDIAAGEEPSVDIEEETQHWWHHHPGECYGTLLLPIMVFTSGGIAAISNRLPIKPKPDEQVVS